MCLPVRSVKKYLSRKRPSRAFSGPTQLRQVNWRSPMTGGASTLTTWYCASQFGQLNGEAGRLSVMRCNPTAERTAHNQTSANQVPSNGLVQAAGAGEAPLAISAATRRLNLSPAHLSHWLVEPPGSFLFEHDLFGKPVPTFPDRAPAEPNAEKCHEILKPRLQSWNWPRCGRAAEPVATTTERHDLFRVALSAPDRESKAGADARSCKGSLVSRSAVNHAAELAACWC